MSNGNKAKSEFLGMPHGTAANRLRKMLLFKYVQLAGDDCCYVCEDRIESVDALSIEHIEPWLNRDIERYWDLDNIAFSHRACNVPHARHQPNPRKMGPEGTAWCSKHQEFLPVEQFHKNPTKASGYKSYCKECAKVWLRGS